jgi:hypothetical protein
MDYGIPQIQRSVNWLNALTLGADNTGGQDISKIVLAAAQTSRDIYLPEGTFLWSNNITLPDNTVIRGAGRKKTTILLKTNITAINMGFNCQISDLEFLGTYGGTGNTNQRCISIDTKYGNSIDNVGFSFIGGHSVYLTGTALATPPVNGGFYGNRISQCVGNTSGGAGVFMDVRAEYTICVGNTFNECAQAFRIAGGNNMIVGNNCTINGYGVYIEGGTNNGHGIVTGNTLNHCSLGGVYATAVTLGMRITGNMIYASRIQLLNSNGITISDNDIEFLTDITVTNCTDTKFINNRFSTVPTWTITGTAPQVSGPEIIVSKTANYTVVPSDADTFFNNTGAGGTVNFTLLSNFVGMKFTFYIDAAQTLTVTAPASTTIRIAGSVSAAAGNISANTVGNCVTLKCISATQWVAISNEGTWTVT